MPTLTSVNANLLASVVEDAALLATPITKVGFSYANMLTAANESSDTDGFMVTGIANGKLFINTGTASVPVYKELVNGTGGITPTQIQVDFTTATALPGGATAVSAANLGLTVRLTGVFYNNTKISGSDSKIYWEPSIPANFSGNQEAFFLRSADNQNGTWSDGGDLISAAPSVALSVKFTAVNDAPTATAATGMQTATEQTNFNLHGTGLSVADADLVGGLINTVVNVTLAVAQGGVTVAAGDSGATVFSGNGSGSVVVTGTLAQVNALLGGSGTGTVVYLNGSDAPSTSTALTLTVNDNNVAPAQGPGPALTGSSTTTIFITAVNDAPVNSVPGAQGAIANFVVFNAVNGNLLSVSDVDADAGTITTTLSVTGGGSLTVTGAGVTGSGTNTVVITGTVNEVNQVLADGVIFSGTGDATLTMLTDDGGNTGTPGALTDSDEVLIGVTPNVISVTEPTAGFYSVANGMDPTYVVTYDGTVVVDTTGGTPTIAINVGGTMVNATYVSTSGMSLTFTYDVLMAHDDADGIVAAGPIVLNGGTIKSPGGTNASLTLIDLDPTPGVLVDNVAPVDPAALNLDAADDSNVDTDNTTSVNLALTIDGTGETGSTVTLFSDEDSSGTFSVGDTILGTSAVSGGTWTADLTGTLTDGVYDILAYATDAASNVSAASAALTITVDTAAPAAPAALDLLVGSDTGTSDTDDITNATTPDISGTGENGAVVTLTSSIAGVVGTATVAGGVWTIASSTLGDGAHSLTATQMDLAGNVSVASSALVVTVDTAVAAPTGLDLATASDSGSSSTDDITNVNTPVINGVGEEGATVTLTSTVDGMVGITVVASGVWSITTNGLSAAAHTLTATQTDVAGNTSAASTGLVVTTDYTAPAAPSAPDLAAIDDTGVSDTDNVTKTTTALTFSGTAEDGSTVTLFNDANDNGALDGAEATLGSGTATGGNWSFDASTMLQGTYIVRAFATDVAGNAGAASAGATTLTVEVDTTAPSAPTGLALAAADDSGVSNADGITNVTSNLTITGSAANNAVVSIYQGATLLGTATANGSGAFTYDVVGPVAEGAYAYTATQVDLAGNVSAPSTALNITIDTTGPNVTYNSAHYDVSAHVLTLEGTGWLETGAAGTDIKAQLDATGLEWDTNSDGTVDYTLASADILSAIVRDDRTLVVTLDTTTNVTDLEADGAFGSSSATVLSDLDFIDISAAFAGTDVAGNVGTGDVADLLVLGAQNQGAMPHTYSANLVLSSDVTDDTLGEGVSFVQWGTNFDSLTLSGASAAQTSVENQGGGAYVLTQLDGLGHGSANLMLLSGLLSDLDTEVTFADGSVIKENTGASNTLRGTSHDDQLIAGSNGDRLLGNAGDDLLIGGSGSDAIYGGTGNDIIVGGMGNDYLSGGSGLDVFKYTFTDTDSEGYDSIYSFGSTDVVLINGMTAADALAAAVNSGADKLITINSTETIRLLGGASLTLTLANFMDPTAP